MANEKRNLIDSDDLIDSLGVSDMEIFAKEAIREAPLVDAVEVVRCKDCTHREGGLCPMEAIGEYPWNATKDDDFCSYGERRTNEPEKPV